MTTTDATSVRLQGEYAARYEPLVGEFLRGFNAGEELGAAVCVYQRGDKVVDVWAGCADEGSGRQWSEETGAVIMSSTKALTATCILMAAESGRLSLDTPVADYWPDFRAGGKAGVTVRDVLSHRAGIPVIDAPLVYEDLARWTPVVDAIAAQSPAWEPGTRHGYHPVSSGWVLSEILHRVEGRTARAYFSDKIAGPLGLALSIGMRPGENRDVATMVFPDPAATDPDSPLARAFADTQSLLFRAFANPVIAPYDYNSREVLELEIPSGNGIATARSLARLYACLIGEVDGCRLLQPETVEAARAVQSSGMDEVLGVRSDFGLGFMVPGGPMFPEWGAKAFGHGGAGGSLGCADPDAGIAFGYVMNKMAPGLGAAERSAALISTAYECART